MTSFPDHPSVAAAADGDFIVVWRSNGSSGTDTSNTSIQGQRYTSNGSAQGPQFQMNTYTTSSQSVFSSVAAAPNENFVVAWESDGSSGTDTSYASIQGQRYRAPIAAPAMSSTTRFALVPATDPGRFLRPTRRPDGSGGLRSGDAILERYCRAAGES